MEILRTRAAVSFRSWLILLPILYPDNSWAQTDGCAPYPIAVRLADVTLENTTSRGVALSVGDKRQQFAFLPQWYATDVFFGSCFPSCVLLKSHGLIGPLNNTILFGINGHCGGSWSEAACTTFRGGRYDASQSESARSDSHPTEGDPYPSFDWVTDSITLSPNTTLEEFPVGIPCGDWDSQGYHPQAAFGLGRNSTILRWLRSAGLITSRSWAMSWGQVGDKPRTQSDGSFVFGGFDRAKTTGRNFTENLNYGNPACASGMFVAITDIVLNFVNGTRASLFDEIQSTAMGACIVPDYPSLLTMPFDPYFRRFQSLTGLPIDERAFGIHYYNMLYDNAANAYDGDMTISFSSGFTARIPNSQLVLQNTAIDGSTGKIVANSSTRVLAINSIQAGNADDLPKIGRQFLTGAYLMFNQDVEQFTLWEATHTGNEALVAVTEQNRPVERFCAAASPNTSPPTPAPPPGGYGDQNNDQGGLSAGRIVGIVLGSLSFVAVLLAAAFLCPFGKKRPAAENNANDPCLGHDDTPPYCRPQSTHELGPGHMNPYKRNELHDDSMPRELPEQLPSP